MYEQFFAERVAQLRGKKGVSARDMSLSLGQNRNYINQIESGKALPSMQVFFYICEYFGITPMQFFDDGAENPVKLGELIDNLKQLDDTALTHVNGVVVEMIGKRPQG